MGEFLDELRQNPLVLAVGGILLAIGIVLLHKQVATGTPMATGIGATPAIDPNTGLPYTPTPATTNIFNSYPVMTTGTTTTGTQQQQSSSYLAYVRAKYSQPSVQTYDAKYSGVPVRDLSGNVISTVPFGESVTVTGNPITGSSNLPGTQAGTTNWLPVMLGNIKGWISSFDLTGLQGNASIDTSQSLHIGSGGLPTPAHKSVQVVASTSLRKPPAKAKYMVVEPWPSPNSTLSGIASASGVSVSRLEALNPQIHNPNLIYPGMHVRVA
jgi:LysM repeat protein